MPLEGRREDKAYVRGGSGKVLIDHGEALSRTARPGVLFCGGEKKERGVENGFSSKEKSAQDGTGCPGAAGHDVSKDRQRISQGGRRDRLALRTGRRGRPAKYKGGSRPFMARIGGTGSRSGGKEGLGLAPKPTCVKEL